MTTLQKLKADAKSRATARGHRMKRFRTHDKDGVCAAFCRVCGKQAWIYTDLKQHGLQIHGEAVTAHCGVVGEA